MNITAVPGVLYPPGAITDNSTNLTNEIIATCEDPTYALGKDRFLLDDAGAFYWSKDGTTTKKVTSTSSFTGATTDMVTWYDTSTGLNNVYATTSAGSSGDIVKYNRATGLDEVWWKTTVDGGQGALSDRTAWRPLLVYERQLYVGDANKLHRINEDLTVSNGILTLPGVETISALGIDKGSGRILIATSGGVNANSSLSLTTRIHLYDGKSNKSDRVVIIEGLVTAFKNVGDTTYVFYGNKLGFWTGAGIAYLRTLNGVQGDSVNLSYPHRVAAIDNTLYFVDNLPLNTGIHKQIMAYGETINNIKSFYPVLYPSAPADSLTALFPVTSTDLGYSYATSKFFTFDTTSVAATTAGGAVMYSRRYDFPRKVTIHGAIVQFDDGIPTGDENLMTLTFLKSDGTSAITDALNPGTRSGIREHEFTYPTIETRSVQVKVTINNIGSKVFGIRRITVFYTPKE